jgi:hypothetical protein
VLAASLVALSASAALAADMPGSWVPPVAAAPSCGARVDSVYLPPKTAYIVAGTCGRDTDWIKSTFHHLIAMPGDQRLLVYYNGGSMRHPDITSIDVPWAPPSVVNR